MDETLLSDILAAFNLERTQRLFDNMPAAAYYKDLTGKYIWRNSTAANMMAMAGFLKYSERDSVFGKTDKDLFGSEVGEAFQEHDQCILEQSSNQQTSFIEYVKLANQDLVLLLSQKRPFFDSGGQVAGVIGCSIILEPTHMNQLMTLLKRTRSNEQLLIKELQDCLEEQDVSALKKSCVKLHHLAEISHAHPDIKQLLLLTRAELVCLCLVAKGHVNKTIATMLNISPRTVEIHISHCKNKLGYDNRHQLIAWFWALFAKVLQTSTLF